MATNYPTSLDTYTDTASTESVGAAGGGQGVSVILNNAQDAIEALQAKVGVDSSAVATSLDYRVATLEGATTGDVTGPASSTDNNIAVYNGVTGKIIKDGGNTVAGVLSRANHTGTQTASTISDFDTEVSNNTDVSANTSARHTRSHTMTSTSDHTATAHRTFYSDASGNVTELAHGTSGQVYTSNGASAAPTWEDAASGGGATTNNARGDSSSTFSTTSASLVDVTSCSATLTTTGGNVLVSISVRAIAVNTAPVNAEMAIDYDGTGNIIPGGNTNVRLLDTGFFNFSYTFIHTSVTAASHTWKLQLKSDGSKQITVYNAVINVIEL